MRRRNNDVTAKFAGFKLPEENWTKLPNELIEALPLVETLGELKVILYVLRHTWGFQEYETEHGKKITLDEFANGRKRKNRSRLDGGTGMDRKTIIDGISRAIHHGFLRVETDDRDLARIKQFFSLVLLHDGKSATSDVQKLDPAVEEVTPSGGKSPPRSEKETFETNPEKEYCRQTYAADAAVLGVYPPKSSTKETARLSRPGAAGRKSCSTELTEYVLDLAKSSAPVKDRCRYAKDEECALTAYEAKFGAAFIRDQALAFQSSGEGGRALIVHLLRFLDQYNPNANKPKSAQGMAMYVPPSPDEEMADENDRL